MAGVGIVGRGFGLAVHEPGWRLVPGVEVVGVAGRDWRELLGDPRVEIVSVATPPATHAELGLAALAAGKSVLCEKPLATTVADAERLVAAAAGARTAVNFSYRALPAFDRFRELLGDEPLEVVWRAGSRLQPGPPGWKDDPLQGGALAAYGVHALDYVEWLRGPTEVLGARVEGAEDAVSIELSTGCLEISLVSREHVHRLRSGDLVLENADRRDPVRAFTLRRGGVELEVPPPRFRVSRAADGRIEPLATHAAALLAGDPDVPSFADGLRAQRLLDDVRRLAS